MIHTLDRPLMCTMMIVISSVRFSCSSHSLYDSPAIAAHASRGSVYLATYITVREKPGKRKMPLTTIKRKNKVDNVVTIPCIKHLVKLLSLPKNLIFTN